MKLQAAMESGKPIYLQEKRKKGEPIEYYKFFKRGTGPFDDHPNCYFASMKKNRLTLIDWWYIINTKVGMSSKWRISQKEIDFERIESMGNNG